MEVNNLDLDAFESATHALLQARESGKIEAWIPNLWPNAPVPVSMGKSSHENAPQECQCCASSHEQSDPEKSTEWIFQGYLFALSRIPQEFLLIEQICLVRLQCAKAMLL